jgi:hypothetical protein
MRMLPVALDSCPTSLLVDETGHPIWPASSQLQMDLLASTARRTGSTLRMAPSHVFDTERHNKDGGTVASFEPSLWPDGQLYAHLTGRRFTPLDDARRLFEIDDLEVVICSSEAVSSSLLHLMYDPVRRSSPGLVYGRTPEEVRAQVLRASALAQLATRAEGTYVQISPDLGSGSIEERSWVVNAVTLDASVLAVLTHSDGLDAPLVKGADRDKLLICPIRHDLAVTPQRTPECRHSGWCHRLRTPVEDAFLRGELIDPSGFRARVLVWGTCFGTVDSGAPLDRQWSVVHHFNLNPHIDVILTKWRGAFGPGPFSELLQSLAAGTRVGEAVAAFNASEGVFERGTQFAILGDPRLTAPFSELHPGIDTFYLRSASEAQRLPAAAPASDEERPASGFVALLRDCIKTPLRHDDEERQAVVARQEFERAYAELRRNTTDPACIARLQNATLACFRRYADVMRAWSPHVTAWTFSLGGHCAHCGELKSQSMNDFATSLRPRRVGTCPRCQVVEDSPFDFDLDFRVTDDRQIELVGDLPHGRFAGIVVVWSTTPNAGTVLDWPVAADGRPIRRVELDIEWPRATARVTVWMMFDLQYLTLNHRIQGAGKPSAQS